MNFSDSIVGARRGYRARSSRRRRRRQENGAEELGDLSDSEDETLGRKLARLKREAEEVRLELQRREQEKDVDAEFKDSVEQQQSGGEDVPTDFDGVEQLSRILDGLSTQARSNIGHTMEDEFITRLNSSSRQRQGQRIPQPGEDAQQKDGSEAPSNLSAVAAFSDRLTALESALGVSSTSATSQTTTILPTLESLSSQITALSGTLVPKTTTAAGPAANTTPLLDTVSAKLKTLIAESERLTASRKEAIASLNDLHEKRQQHLVSMSATLHSNPRPRRGLSNSSSTAPGAGANAIPSGAIAAGADADTAGPGEESLALQSQLFLDEQSTKITALYQLLPSIQNLQPLLPVVLERLRALSVVHAGAANAKETLDDVEKRQGEMRAEIRQWREAIDGVEAGIKDLETVMKGNVKVVGEMVSGLEERVGKVESAR